MEPGHKPLVDDDGIGAGYSYPRTPSMNVLLVLLGVIEALGVAAIAMVCYWTAHYRGGFAWDGTGQEFNWHPVFMVVGMVFLYGNGIIIYRFLPRLAKKKLKLAHAIIHKAAFVFSVLGLVAVFAFHNATGLPNVYSLHSWLGIGTVVLFNAQWVLGMSTYLLPFASRWIRTLFMPYHRFFGLVIFAMSIATCLMGLTEKLLFTINDTYSSFAPEGILVNCLGLTLVLFGGFVGYIATREDWKRQPLPEEQPINMSIE
ncbi:cytochrome b561-like isoform X2 [Branchiostoma floridae]|uniref:Cytochrome b561-like isoform X2 n=1 Tax=Branchiostoma floridae TaxID=7739 RepID=A0A9J7LTI4_BRAFL|nr:cytochrome b561-like isoform X2 [Branchiostoma floridae]